jgi:hypothetical protein
MLDAGYWIPDARYQMPDTRFTRKFLRLCKNAKKYVIARRYDEAISFTINGLLLRQLADRNDVLDYTTFLHSL